MAPLKAIAAIAAIPLAAYGAFAWLYYRIPLDQPNQRYRPR